MKLTEIFTPNSVIEYTNARETTPLPGESLFPSVKQNSMELDYVVGRDGAPVSASIHALDTETEIGTRGVSFDRIKADVALIKQQYGVNEKLLLDLNQMRENSPAVQAAINQIYNDIDRAVTSVNTRIERLRYEALASGKIVVQNENGASFELDYGLVNTGDAKDSQFTELTTKWSDPEADIISDINDMADKMTLQGYVPTRILTSKRVLNTILRNKKVLTYILGSGQVGLLSQDDLNRYLAAHSLPTVGLEDRVYRKQKADGTFEIERFFSDNKVVFLPGTPVGRTVFAPTPQEIRLANNPAVDISKVGNILAMVYDRDVDPVATYTLAVAHVLPSFERANEIHIATVLDPQA